MLDGQLVDLQYVAVKVSRPSVLLVDGIDDPWQLEHLSCAPVPSCLERPSPPFSLLRQIRDFRASAARPVCTDIPQSCIASVSTPRPAAASPESPHLVFS